MEYIAKRHIDVIEVALEVPQDAPSTLLPKDNGVYWLTDCNTLKDADQYVLTKQARTRVEVSVIHDGDAAHPETKRFATEQDADDFIRQVSAMCCACGNLTKYRDSGQYICMPCRQAAEAADPHEWIVEWKAKSGRWRAFRDTRYNLLSLTDALDALGYGPRTLGRWNHLYRPSFESTGARMRNFRTRTVLSIEVDHVDPLTSRVYQAGEWFIQVFERKSERKHSRMIWKTIGVPGFDLTVQGKAIINFGSMTLDSAIAGATGLKQLWPGVTFKLVEPATGQFIMADVLTTSESLGMVAA